MGSTALILLLGLFLLGSIGMIVFGLRRGRQPSVTLEERLAQFGTLERPPTLEELEMSASFSERIVYPTIDTLSKFVSQFTPAKSMENVRHKLDLADNPGNLTMQTLLSFALWLCLS